VVVVPAGRRGITLLTAVTPGRIELGLGSNRSRHLVSTKSELGPRIKGRVNVPGDTQAQDAFTFS